MAVCKYIYSDKVTNKVTKCHYDCVDENEDKCILHCEKTEENGWFKVNDDGIKSWEDEKKNQFWLCIQKNIEYLIDNSFENIIFPKFEDETEETHQSSNFYTEQKDTITDLITKRKITFKNCTFLDIANFKKYNFEQEIIFDNCNFNKGILLNTIYSAALKFIKQCDFKKNDLNLSNIDFNNDFLFRNNINIEHLYCINTNFNMASFRDSKFKKTTFLYTSFNDKVNFADTEFIEVLNFEYTTFEKLAIFKNAKFYKSLNLENTLFKDEANFLNLKNKAGNKIESENIENRETARIIKHSFEKQDNIIEANKFYALEMKEREKELENELKDKEKRTLKTFIDYTIFKLHGLSSNHSQDSFLVLFWIVFVGLIASLYDMSIQTTLVNSINVNITIVSIFLIAIFNLISSNYRKYNKYIFIILLLFLFILNNSLIIDDCSFSFAKTINPFSVMKGEDNIDIFQLLFKITIAYLIYQFIVSVRQNTRRK